MIDVQWQIQEAIRKLQDTHALLVKLDGFEEYQTRLEETVVDLYAELDELNSLESK